MQIGAFKDDPHLGEMLEEIHKQRGRRDAEENTDFAVRFDDAGQVKGGAADPARDKLKDYLNRNRRNVLPSRFLGVG
jgi:hypothetical protein